ncbi:MAG: MlaC/ttg2D family ABC transporter substrate-binding protein [Pseudomonadota bacterium]
MRAWSRRLLLVGAMVLAFGAGLGPAAALEPAAARSFIADLAQRATVILNSDESLEQRRDDLRVLLYEGFDVGFIAATVLGPPFRDLSEAQRTAYLEAFEQWVVSTYASRLDDYSGQRLEMVSAEPIGRNDVRVATRVVGADQPVRIDWRVRERSGSLQIIDIEVEGIGSMVVTHRNEFNSVVQRRGVEGLISVLQERAATVSS